MSKANKESAKTENKKKEKVVNDLTFGLKNKNKSKVVQQYVKEVTNKVMFSNVKVNKILFLLFTKHVDINSMLGWNESCGRIEQREKRSEKE